MRGRVEKDGKVLVLTAVEVTYHLKIDSEHQETAERVHGFHAAFCPVARSIRDSVRISTQLVVV